MPLKSDWKLSEEACRSATLLVVEEIARRRISRRHLADMARISLSTLEKVLSGRRPLTLSTLVKLEDALGLSLRSNGGDGSGGAANGKHALPTPEKGATSGVAPDDLGSYARPAVRWIEGQYLTLRPSFGNSRAVYAYVTEIIWDDAQSVLTFREAERTDKEFAQFGQVAVPNQSGHVYLVTNRHGQHRMIVVSRPTISGEMHGVLTTLKVGRGSALTPVAAPIALVPMRAGAPAPAFGQIMPGHADYESYRAVLRRTTGEGFAELLVG
ncbi:MAG: helix-turn-helix transcriptional regulator [Hyphomicrobiaceae bacterium]